MRKKFVAILVIFQMVTCTKPSTYDCCDCDMGGLSTDSLIFEKEGGIITIYSNEPYWKMLPWLTYNDTTYFFLEKERVGEFKNKSFGVVVVADTAISNERHIVLGEYYTVKGFVFPQFEITACSTELSITLCSNIINSNNSITLYVQDGKGMCEIQTIDILQKDFDF